MSMKEYLTNLKEIKIYLIKLSCQILILFLREIILPFLCMVKLILVKHIL